MMRPRRADVSVIIQKCRANDRVWKNQPADMVMTAPRTTTTHTAEGRPVSTLCSRMRLHSVETGLPSAVWVVVVLGAVITISAGWFFQTLSFALHFWMMTLTSALLGLIIWLLVVMDHPFIGAVSVGPGPFVQVYKTVMASGH